jgi:hypothetical protein
MVQYVMWLIRSRFSIYRKTWQGRESNMTPINQMEYYKINVRDKTVYTPDFQALMPHGSDISTTINVVLMQQVNVCEIPSSSSGCIYSRTKSAW